MVLLDSGYVLDEIEFDAPREDLMIDLDLTKRKEWIEDASVFKSRLHPHVITEDRTIRALAQCMHDEILGGCQSGKIYEESLSLALMSYVWGHYSPGPTAISRSLNGLSTPKLRRLQEYIDSNLSADLTLNELAALVNLNARHLCRSFKQATGTTPHQYILGARIARAKELLAQGNYSIAEVALLLGFSSQSHFADVFRKRCGMSPGQFLRRP